MVQPLHLWYVLPGKLAGPKSYGRYNQEMENLCSYQLKLDSLVIQSNSLETILIELHRQ
jgi:hypothetical protein